MLDSDADRARGYRIALVALSGSVDLYDGASEDIDPIARAVGKGRGVSALVGRDVLDTQGFSSGIIFSEEYVGAETGPLPLMSFGNVEDFSFLSICALFRFTVSVTGNFLPSITSSSIVDGRVDWNRRKRGIDLSSPLSFADAALVIPALRLLIKAFSAGAEAHTREN